MAQFLFMKKGLFLVASIILLCCCSIFATPTFSGGTSQTTSMCAVAGHTDISTLLGVSDTAGVTEYWNLVSVSHGSVTSGLPDTVVSTGAGTMPSGSVIYNPGSYTGTDTIVVSVTDGTTTAFTTIVINVIASPAAAAISGVFSVCAGSMATLTDAASGGTWHERTGRTSVSGGVVSGITPGIDTIIYLVGNSCGSDSATHAIVVIGLPSAGSISGPGSVCVSSTIYLTDASSGGLWTSSNAHASITGAGVVSGLSTGIDTISYTVYNSCGVDVATYAVTVNPLPDAGTISGVSAVCAASMITLTDAAAGGTWSTSNGHATVAGGVVSGITAGMDSIIYTSVTPCGMASAARVITVNPLPFAGSVSGSTVICAGTMSTLTDTITGGNWSASNGNATVTGGVVSALSAGTDTIYYTYINSCGTDIAPHIITINPAPYAGTISGTSAVCVGGMITLTDTTSGGTWGASNAHATDTSGVVMGVSAGIDSITYSVTNGCGTAVAMQAVTILTVPVVAAITGPHAACTLSSVTLSDATSGGTWSATNGNATVTGGVVSGMSWGMDTIGYKVTNMCGMDSVSLAIIIDTALPVGGHITGPTGVCVGDSILLSDTATGGVWVSLNTTRATVNTTGTVHGHVAGPDVIVYRITNGCGTVRDSAHIEVHPLPYAAVIGGYDSVCLGSIITLTDSVSGGIWTSSSIDIAPVDSITGVVSGGLHGSATITYTVTNVCGTAFATHDVNVNVPAFPILGTTPVCQGSPAVFIDPIPGGTWSSDNFLVLPLFGTTGTTIGLTVGTANVTYTLNNACGTTTASMSVDVINCPPAAVTGPGNIVSTEITVSPNPNTGDFMITIPSQGTEDAAVVITNVTGQKVKELSIPVNKQVQLTLQVPDGIYFMNISNGEQRSATKIVVEN